MAKLREGAYVGRKHSLTPAQAKELRSRVAAGESRTALAGELGISRQTLYRYVAGAKKSIRQRVMHCPCGNAKVLALGLCATCYTLKRQDEEYFGGLREAVLERGYRCRVCDASGRDKRSIIVRPEIGPEPHAVVLSGLSCQDRPHQGGSFCNATTSSGAMAGAASEGQEQTHSISLASGLWQRRDGL